MSKPTLTYFDFPGGRGEDVRLALHIAGIDWNDDRFRGNWPERKATTPYGSLPTLEVPGRGVLAQSNAILAYIGRAYGLLPDDSFECARHESVMHAVEDLRSQLATTDRDDADAKREARQAFASGYMTQWAKNISAQIQGPFVGGAELSVADLKLYVALSAYRKGVFDHVPTDVLDGWPKITALLAAVEAHPRVAEWNARFVG